MFNKWENKENLNMGKKSNNLFLCWQPSVIEIYFIKWVLFLKWNLKATFFLLFYFIFAFKHE